MSSVYEKIRLIHQEWMPTIECAWALNLNPDGSLRVFATNGPATTATIDVDWPLGPDFLSTLNAVLVEKLSPPPVEDLANALISLEGSKIAALDTSSMGNDGCFLNTKGALNACNN